MKLHTPIHFLLLIFSLFFSLNTLVHSAENSSAIAAVVNLSNDLGLGGNNDDILHPDVAFKLTTEIKDANTIIAYWQIADKHYLYRNKFKFTLKKGNDVQLGSAVLPAGKTKNDEFFGRIQVFYNVAKAVIPLSRLNKNTSKIEIQFTYQGCAEETGICYPPIRKKISFDLPAGGLVVAEINPSSAKLPSKQASSNSSVIANSRTTNTSNTIAFVSEQDKSLQVLKSGDALEILFYFFLGGLALAFTACMYPMIPILSSLIVGQGEQITRRKAFAISMAYVQSMAVTFGILGAAVAIFAGGVNFQAYFQSPWILIPFSILFVALAFSMFGFYSIQMPSSVQSWLNNFSNKQKGGSLHGAIFMGAASALIIGPCAGPVIIGALAYVATESDPLLGFLAMFILGNGLGLPLLAVGTFGGHILPKAGTWMETVKAGAGIVLLAIALLFLERISFISSTLIMMLWATLFIVIGVYLGALEAIKENVSGWFKLWKGLGVVFIVYGFIVMLGGLTGARNFDDPMHGSSLTLGGGSQVQHLKFKRIKTKQDLINEINIARTMNKYVMLDFYADWCTYCKKFEDYVFSNAEVQELLKDFILLQADVTANDDADIALNKFTSVQAPPAILFFNKEGKEIRNYRIVGDMDAKTFLKHVKRMINN